MEYMFEPMYLKSKYKNGLKSRLINRNVYYEMKYNFQQWMSRLAHR